jgi:hypothetical protein
MISDMNFHQPIPDLPVEETDLFEMSNLYPKHTGLPMTVWVGVKGGARHDVRVKVCRTHGDRMDIHDTAVVSVRPTPELIEGPLRTADLKAVQAWIALNAEVLVGHWNGDLDSIDLAQALKKI